MFSPDKKALLAQLKPSQSVRVSGTIKRFGVTPIVEDCELVWAAPPT